MAITVMKRYELKYLLSPQQTEYLCRALEGHMLVDAFGLTSIASLYYDTPDCRLIRASLEKPVFKEKLRLRSYGLATEVSPVFLELKRKYDGVVYKRRVQTTIPQAEAFFAGAGEIGPDGQIRKELVRFRDFYRTLIPACLIIYDRTAYYEPEGDLRLTIDHRPRYRMEGLSLSESMDGLQLLEDGWSILEVKVQQAMPLWLSAILSAGGIYKSSFSKYGEAYRRQLTAEKAETPVIPVPRLPGAA
ncbi:MAG: polyphosphate polymerase domain-containing protein [Oscillospiraceae bacterium]|nr:polyphosphate polymerase domain-containing protein [Oscillospiraceae bacterium]